MPTQIKSDKIVELTDKLNRASVTILVQTQGLKVKDMNELRARMRAAKVEFQIAKNTLLRIASERNNMTELDKSIFNGQNAVAFGYDDEVAAAKAINDYVVTSKIVVLKSGILGGRSSYSRTGRETGEDAWRQEAGQSSGGWHHPESSGQSCWFVYRALARPLLCSSSPRRSDAERQRGVIICLAA